MSIWLSWVALGILFVIVEMFFLTLDFLAIGVAAIVTGLIVSISGGVLDPIQNSSFIFAGLGIVFLITSRKYLLPKLQKTNLSKGVMADKIIGERVLVQNLDQQIVTYYEGNYWNLSSSDELKQGDTAEVIAIEGNRLVVKKLF